jgi:DNA mismatch endonuclease (patch repair protein)
MLANRRRNTRPEIAVRRVLHAHGLRFRVDHPVFAGGFRVRPDIVFPRQRVAVFIDGCFWHGCPQHGTMPVHNRDYWESKLARNRERDAWQSAVLAEVGWHVVRYWTHESVAQIAVSITRAVRATGMDGQTTADPSANVL